MSLIERITLALAGEPPHGLLPGDLIEGHEGEPRQAAVLVAITDRPKPGLILTQRRDDLRTHAGQVAFPGFSPFGRWNTNKSPDPSKAIDTQSVNVRLWWAAGSSEHVSAGFPEPGWSTLEPLLDPSGRVDLQQRITPVLGDPK